MSLFLQPFSKNRSLRLMAVIASVPMAGAMTACGKDNLIRSVSGETKILDNGNAVVEVKSVWDTGNVRVPAIDLPIPNPEDTSQTIGSLSLKEVFPTGAEVTIGLDLTVLADLDSDNALLPNGTSIPIGGLGDTPIIGIPVADTAAKAYFALGSGIALLGFAVPFKEFDEIGRNTGRSNLFLPFDFGSVRGTGGMFCSPNPGKTGLGLFVDIGPLIKDLGGSSAQRDGLAVASLSSAPTTGVSRVLAAMQEGDGPRKAQFYERRMSGRADQNLRKGLYRLHQRGAVVHPSR
jgi:hypothetical protein